MCITIETEQKLKDNGIQFLIRNDDVVLLKPKEDKTLKRFYFPHDETINYNIERIIDKFK